MRHLTIFIVLLSLSTQAQNYDNTFSAKVITVIDGNTLEVLDENDEVVRFQLSEVDAPELGQEKGNEAKVFTETLMLKKKVVIERVGKDWLGNKLAVIQLKNGKLLHEELLKEGLGWASNKASSQSISLQDNAKDQKIGIWSIPEPTPPWIYRRQQTMLSAKAR